MLSQGTLQISTKTQVLSQGTHAGQESSQAQTQPPLGTNGFTPAIHTHDSQLPSPSRTLVQQPIAWEPPDESLPDLGRFPAMRRRRGAGRKPRLVKDSQTGSSPQSDHLATPSQTSQTLAYEHQNRSFPAGSALGLKSYVQTGQLNGNLDSSKTTPGHRIRSPAGLEDRPTSRLPSEVPPHPQSERQVSGSIGLEGEHALHSDTAQTRTPTPSTVPAQSFQASQQAQQSFSARPPIASSNSDSPAGIIWPDSKKTALATAAKIALTCTSVNAGKKISTAHIRALLDSNPSYIELCESFEGMGFVFDRGHFARSLLAAVPDVNSTVPTQSVTNAPLQNLNEANSMSRKSTGATPPASTAPGEQLIPSNAMAESNVRGPPNLTAMDGLSAIAPETPRPGPGRPSKHGSPAQPFVISPSILNRGPGRPRKDGSPAQPRKAAHLRQSYGDDADSHMPIGTLPTVGETSRAFRKDPAPSSNTANDEERLGRYGDLHRNGHGLSATRYSDDHRQSEDVGDASQIVARTEHGTPSIKEPALQNGADVGHTDRIFGSGIAGAVQRQASKKRRRFTVRWDNQRNMTKSSEVLKRQGPLLDTEVEPQNMAVDASVKRGVAPNLKGGPLRAAISSNLPPPNYGTPELSTLRVVTKEEMARKRSFDDIVDLTQDLSGEDDDLHRTSKKRHEEDAFRTSDTIQDGLSVGAFPLADPQALAVSSNPRSGVGTPITTGDISRFNYVTSGPLSQKQALYMDVIKPLNKKDALRRSEYNAKTIARDVLIATGRHPDMRPLNAHLEHLRRNFFAVAHTSDLDTFDWGLVDPDPVVNTVQGPDALMHDADDEDDGVTPAQYLTAVATPPQQARRRVMSTTNGEAEVLGNGEYHILILCVWLTVLTIAALDVLVQKPGKGTLLKRRGPRRHNDPGHRARPAGIGDVGNADRNSGRVQAFTSEKKPSGQTAGADGTSDSMAHGEMRAYAAGEATSESRIPGMAQTSQLVGTDGKKPRGRPPNSARASSSTSSRGAQQLRASSSKDDTDEDMVKRRRGRPPGSKNLASPTSSGPPAGQFAVPTRPKSSANTTPARSGLRNASTPCENQPFAVVIETNSPSINSSFAPGRGAGIQRKRKSESREPIRRTRGRPSTASRAEPSYKVYDCQWQDCKAELHNLETLRKHIRKVHRAKAAFGGIPCLWADCGKVSFVQDRKTGSHTRVHHHLDFGSEALWDEHMDRKHLEAFAWGYGDGPSAGPSGWCSPMSWII